MRASMLLIQIRFELKFVVPCISEGFGKSDQEVDRLFFYRPNFTCILMF